MIGSKGSIAVRQTLEQHPESLPRDDGVFLSEEINAVEQMHEIDKERVTPYATFRKQLATMEDGSRYIVTSTDIPDKYQRDSSDIMSIETSAWLTKGAGLYTRRALHLARLAIPSTFVGVQQNLNRFGHLPNAAHDQLEIAKHIASQQGYDLSHAIGNGISRGGMATLIATALAQQHGISMRYFDASVPGFPIGFDLARDLGSLLKFPINEMSALKSFSAVPLKNMIHLPATLDTSLRGAFQQIKEVPTILKGDVGHHIPSLPADAFGHVGAYEGDMVSQGARYKEELSPFPNVIVDLQPGGGHSNCFLEECCGGWKSRDGGVVEVLHDDPSTRYLGGTAFRLLAAERNLEFAQPGDEALRVSMSRVG